MRFWKKKISDTLLTTVLKKNSVILEENKKNISDTLLTTVRGTQWLKGGQKSKKNFFKVK